MINIGIIGSGFIAKGFFLFSKSKPDIKISAVLTRTDIKTRNDWPNNILSNNIDYVLNNSDIILECSGDTVYATECIDHILKTNVKLIISMNSEFHITVGHHFINKLIIAEAEGDQSGCMFQFNREIVDMGFEPLVFGNYKRYLNYNVSYRQAKYWSEKNGISIDKTIAFTDGSKVEIENVLIANSLNAHFYDYSGKDKLQKLIDQSKITGVPLVDFIVDKKAPSGIFIATKHSQEQNNYIKYLKFNTEFQILVRPYHFCHLEIYKTIKQLYKNNNCEYMSNKYNNYMVASITKKKLKAGSIITLGLGSLEVRGIHYKYSKNMIPITLLNNIIIKKDLPENHIISFEDIELKPNLAINIWRNGY